MSERAAPYHCPYCGEEDLRPSDAGRGAWECGACLRVFTVTFLGLRPPPQPTTPIREASPTRKEAVP